MSPLRTDLDCKYKLATVVLTRVAHGVVSRLDPSRNMLFPCAIELCPKGLGARYSIKISYMEMVVVMVLSIAPNGYGGLINPIQLSALYIAIGISARRISSYAIASGRR